jgi:hypothetical protein
MRLATRGLAVASLCLASRVAAQDSLRISRAIVAHRRIPPSGIVLIVVVGLICVGLGIYLLMYTPSDAAELFTAGEALEPALPARRAVPMDATLKAPPKAPSNAPAKAPDRSLAVSITLSIRGTGRETIVRLVELSERQTIGRDSKVANIAVSDDSQLSRRHCSIELEHGVVVIRDLRSRNGTFVNGIRISAKHRLEDRDVIRVGDTEIAVGMAGVSVPREVRR